MNKHGQVSAKKVGALCEVVIYAEARDENGAADEISITVLPAPKSIKIWVDGEVADRIELSALSSQRLSATVLPADANQQVTWSSANTKIATVDETGIITAHKAGKVKIVAKSINGVKAIILVAVK